MNSKTKKGLILAVSLSLVSCVSKPLLYASKEITLSLPDQWTVNENIIKTKKAGWVQELYSEKLDELPIVSVGIIHHIEKALAGNPNIQLLNTRLKEESLRKRIANKNRLPSVELQLDGTRNELLTGTASESEELELQLLSSWEPDIWGRLSSLEKVAFWQQKAAEETLHFTRLSLSGQIAQLWMQAIQQEQLISLNKQELESWQFSLQIVKNDYETGVSTQTAVHLTQTQLALTKASYHQLIQNRDNTIRQIQVLQGEFPDTARFSTLPSVLPPIPSLHISELSMGVLMQRPDIRSSMAKLEQSDAATSAAYRALYPQLKLTLAPSLITSDLSSISSPSRMLNSTFSVLQPLFSRNRLLLQKRAAETQAEQSYWEYLQAILNASQEIMQGIETHTHLLAQNKQLTIAKEEARLAFNSANEDYEQGVGDVLDWLSLRRSFLAIERQLVNNQSDALQNWIGVNIALAMPALVKSIEDK